MSPTAIDKTQSSSFGRIAAVYLLGLLLGGLYVGLIGPLRTVIQSDMGIDSTVGIWMVNIYTLFYAATISVTGSLADRYGRKRMLSICLGVFSAGALMCGAAQFAGGFTLLIAGRIIQALGAGGIIPVATAEMGASAPEGRRGMWLGISSAVAGVSNVIGAAAGSFIISIVGAQNWCCAFFVAVPIGVLLMIAAAAWLPKSESRAQGRLDVAGSCIFIVMVLCLLLGLSNVDFTDLVGSASSTSTWLPIVVAVCLALVFRVVEHRADHPVFHLKYLHNSRILITMAVSFFVGCSIISMTLVPEFAEYVLNIPVGSGGYYMAVIGVFAIFGPPVCGKIIDKRGAKKVMLAGLLVTALGYLFLAFVAAPHASAPVVLLGLAIVGLGMGFTMGTPLNYMILQNTSPEESTSAIATVALIRQMGTTLAPALLVGFITTGSGISGYVAMLAAVAVFNIFSMLLLLPYKE